MLNRAFLRTLPRFRQRPRSFLPIARISSHAQPHHDLPSYLTHAQNNSLDPKSNVFLGTYYEYLCASTLSRFSFTLTRVGQTGDAGIDLVGDWQLPALPFPLRVLVQCKASSHFGSMPAAVRELEGATAGAPEGWRGTNTVGVLCTKRPATKGAREAVRKSGMPVVYIMVEDIGEGKGRVRQMLWNERVDEIGAEGTAVGTRHVVEEGKGLEKEAVLLWKGKVWEPKPARGSRSRTRAKGVKAKAKTAENGLTRPLKGHKTEADELSQRGGGEVVAGVAVSVSASASKKKEKAEDKAAASTKKAKKTSERIQ